jgi:2-desacetyl-2-hydroxyethyl bacteriochlorophyllide A dehydrogenase
MQAVVCDRPGSLSLVERPDPRPGAGEVLVRVRRMGVCGTDFHIYSGDHPFLQYPRVMGHELSGEVAAAPAGSGLAVGEAVYIVPYLSCGVCRACRKGLTNCCRRISVLGVHQDGGMAEYVAVPQGNVEAAGDLPLDEAAMVEFLAIGAHGIRRGAVSGRDHVLVVGSGPIGMGAVIFAKTRGAHVTVVDGRQDRLDFAASALGADATQKLSPDLEALFGDATDGEFFDVVVDATGNLAAMQRGLNFVGHGGRYVLLSIVRQDIAFPDPEFHKRETTLLSSRNAVPEDFAEVVRQIRAGRVPTRSLATHRAKLADAAGRFDAWLKPEAGVIKALIEI